MKLDLVTGAVSSNNEFEKLPIDYQPDGPEMIPPEEEQDEERGLPGFPRKSPLPEKPMTYGIQIYNLPSNSLAYWFWHFFSGSRSK